mgnify:CR=1 FL=1
MQLYVEERLPMYAKVKLSTDISKLTEAERKVLPLLIQAAQIMDELSGSNLIRSVIACLLL